MAKVAVYLNQPDLAKLILRLMVGVLMLLHGVHKILHGVAFIEGKFSAIGLPAVLAYSVFIGEIIAPIFLIIGFKTRLASVIIIFTMVIAVLLAYPTQWLALTKVGALFLEVQYLYIFSALAVIFLGPGRFSIDRK